ncbi:DUF4391 domain-containing protein [Desulfobacterales bacterium HSG17]|nr:DUF4391 domain-containing protein [Desulfobacterales bacterium HSG17]
MTDAFYKFLAIPNACFLGNRVFKKLFYENAPLAAANKKIFSESISDIRWQYSLKPETINIAKYDDDEKEYHEVAVIQVALKAQNHYMRIAEIIQRAIPYPLMLVFVHENQVLINLALKRINWADSNKITAESFYFTGWFNPESPDKVSQAFLESCAINKLPFTDFYKFYSALVERVVALNCAELSGKFELDGQKSTEDMRKVLETIHALEQEQTSFRNELKNETQFNRKVELNIKIKQIDVQIQGMKDIL